jgi:hypothetical protein
MSGSADRERVKANMEGERMAKPGEPTTIEAERFILRDASGTVRADLGVDTTGTVRLGLMDWNGNCRALLAVGSNGLPMLTLFDRANKARAVMAVGSLDIPLPIRSTDAAGGIKWKGEPDGLHDFVVMNLADPEENPRVKISVGGKNSTPSVGLYTATGEPRADLCVSVDAEHSMLSLSDKQGSPCVQFVVSADGQHHSHKWDRRSLWRRLFKQ